MLLKGSRLYFTHLELWRKTQLQLDSGKTILTAHHSLLNTSRGFSPVATILQARKVRTFEGSLNVVRKTAVPLRQAWVWAGCRGG